MWATFKREETLGKKITGNACDIKYAWDRNALMLRTGESGQKRYTEKRRNRETEKEGGRRAQYRTTNMSLLLAWRESIFKLEFKCF